MRQSEESQNTSHQADPAFQQSTECKILVPEWIEWRESGLHRRPWSETYKELQLIYIHKYFQLFSTVGPKQVEEWLSSVHPQQHSKRKHMHSAISSFAAFLHHRELLNSASFLAIRSLSPKKSPYYRPCPKTITPEQLKTIMVTAAAAHHEYQATLNFAFIHFLSETGLRVSEACNLLLSDLFYGDENNAPYVQVRCGKGGKSRKVPFSKWAQHSLQEHLKLRPKSPYQNVFLAFNPQQGFTPLDKNAVSIRLRRISKKTGISFTAHTFRHYRITQWANNSLIPLPAVQKWAGHTSLVITQQYIHTDTEAALRLAYE